MACRLTTFFFPSFLPPAAGRAGMSRRMVITLGNVIRTHLIHDGQIARKPITRQKYGRGKEGKNLQSRAGMTGSTKEQCRRPVPLHVRPFTHPLVLLPVLCLTRPAPPPHPFNPPRKTDTGFCAMSDCKPKAKAERKKCRIRRERYASIYKTIASARSRFSGSSTVARLNYDFNAPDGC